jgi:hypothetical protein
MNIQLWYSNIIKMAWAIEEKKEFVETYSELDSKVLTNLF